MILTLIVLVLGSLAALLMLRGAIFLVMYCERSITYGCPKVFPLPKRCPRCDSPIRWMDSLRTLRNVLLGGWSCRYCGSEFDQLNDCRVARSWNVHLRDVRERSHLQTLKEESLDPRSPVQKIIDE